MSDIIHLLPDSIANQIAAGEVIQRPASAVKELLENAVDAGALEIKLIIKDAGKSLIQVIDNGCGMSQTDARMCFERHATSKIKNANDLFAIRTMGFRGEAMASIASIAHVELKTRLTGHELGSRILIEGFEFKSQEPCQCAEGTNISVKNLFYNVPARRNFLKSDTVELKHIIDEFERVALAHPALFFSLHNNGVEIFHLKPGNLRQRIIHLFGNNYNEKLVPIEEKTSVSNIKGFIGKPESAKKTRGEQFFFVNNRYIRSAYLNHAVMIMYHKLIADKSYPLYVIFIEIDPKRIDVNVHPTKQEIKFDDERIIYTFINAAVRHALAQYSITPTLDFDVDPTFAHLPGFYMKQKEAVSFKTMKSKMNEMPSAAEFIKPFPHILDNEHFVEPPIEINTHDEALFENTMHKETAQNNSPVFSIHNNYIITQIQSGFIIIDQQAAHERILFEKYMQLLSEKKPATQQQLFPTTLSLSSSDAAIINLILSDINSLGFDIQPFGKDSFVVHGIPAEFDTINEKKILEDLIEQFKENTANIQLNKHEFIAKSFAKSNAVKHGQKLNDKEMHHLIDAMFACKTPFLSPTGNLTFVSFTLDELAKQFQKKT